jgi:NADH:ubiquinone oxidoreductase subunit F (NADH-binding)
MEGETTTGKQRKMQMISTIEAGSEAVSTLSSLVACINRHYTCSMCGTSLTQILSICRHFRVCFTQLFIMVTKIFVEIPNILWTRY